MRPWILLLAGVMATAGIWLHGNSHGRAIAFAESGAKAIAVLREQQDELNTISRKYEDEKNTIIVERDDALTRLRDRKDRVPESTGAKCEGTTGRELSKQDSEFLTREATRADRLRAALKACYSYADSLQGGKR